MVKLKKYICIFTICLFSFVSVARPNIEAQAIGTAIASFFAAIPVSWPVIAGVLIAGGVGTAAWYSTWEPEEKERFVTEVKGRLLEAQLTLGQLVGDAGSTIINGADYVRGSIVDGLCYLGENILDIIWDVSRDFDMLGGNTSSSTMESVVNYNQWFNASIGITSENMQFNGDISSWLNFNGFNNYQTPFQYEYLTGILAGLSNVIIQYTTQGWGSGGVRCNLQYYYPEKIIGKGYHFDSYQGGLPYNTVRCYTLYDSSNHAVEEIVGHQVSVNPDGTVVEYDILGRQASLNPSTVVVQPNNGVLNNNLGTYTIEQGSGAPIGEKGQVTAEQDGAWSVPWASDAAKVIDNVGKALPVSIPHSAEWGVDVPATWDIDVSVPDTLVLPLAEAITRALNPPISITQDVAQEGVIDPPIAVPDTSPVVPDVGQFIVPSFIKDRFPFCIPFDLVRAAKSLSASNTPPEFVYDFHYGDNGVYTFRINFNQFESYIQLFRTAELILFVVSLIAGTRQIMKE